MELSARDAALRRTDHPGLPGADVFGRRTAGRASQGRIPEAGRLAGVAAVGRWFARRLGNPAHALLGDTLRPFCSGQPSVATRPIASAQRGGCSTSGGVAIPNLAAPERTVGHDTAIVGWPWVADTHSWLEPTAVAILALRREGKVDHPRVREGLRLIRDRAIPTGGWNYGNNVAFGRDLRPQPAPTGLALLALAGIDDRSEVVERAVGYLQESLPSTRGSPVSLLGRAGPARLGVLPGGRRRLVGPGFRADARPARLEPAAGSSSAGRGGAFAGATRTVPRGRPA